MASHVRVVTRFRPENETEKNQGTPEHREISFVGTAEVDVPPSGSDQAKTFTFDEVFGMGSTQDDLFTAVGLPTIDNVLKGYNGTILAYGQTGSGKTHSMLGPSGGTADIFNPKSSAHQERGIIPRLAEKLFDRLEALPEAEVTWKVTVSIFELYKEGIFDLLTENQKNAEYRIREDTITGKGVYVENLHAKQCTTAPELLEAIRFGVSKRKVASTKSNDTSSRSHSVTVINVEQVNHVADNLTTSSRLNLVDLAGSEKVAKTQAGGERLKEAQMINLSLTLLGNVIYKLTDGKSAYIPYRDSKLTRILQDSFGGNSVTTLLCHCSPAFYNREETMGTLRFASRAKMIRNKPRVNRELSAKELQLAYAQALERIRSLEERIEIAEKLGVPQHVSPTKRRQETAAEDTEDLRPMVEALMKQVEELKQELFEMQEKLSAANSQVDFYKSRAAEAEAALQEAVSRAKRDKQLADRRILDLESRSPAKLGAKPPSDVAVAQALDPREVKRVGGSTKPRLGAKDGFRRSSVESGDAQAVSLMQPEALMTTEELQPSETLEGSTSAQNMSEAEIVLQLKVEELQDELRKARRKNEDYAQKEREMTSKANRMSTELEQVYSDRDTATKELDALRKLLELRERENAKMKSILNELQIDVDDYELQLGDAKELANAAQTEARKLSVITEGLRETQEQQEFVDMASMELMVKAEDMDAIENEVGYMAMSSLNTDVFASSKASCLETISQIESVMTGISKRLVEGRFNTSNLEGARLNLINECAEFVSRCNAVRRHLFE